MPDAYVLTLNQAKKTITFKMLVAYFEPEDAESFVSEYHQKVNSVIAADYTMVLDCREMKVVKPDMVPALSFCMNLYKESGFKRVVFEVNGKAVLRLQLRRLTKNEGLKAEVIQVA